MAKTLDSVDDLEARIEAFNELLGTLRSCAGRGRFYSIDDIQHCLQAVTASGEDEGPMLTMLLAIAIQRLVFA